MNLYLLTQDDNEGYDTFDSMVVAAKSADDARLIQPNDFGEDLNIWIYNHETWASHPQKVKVQFLGVAAKGTEKGIILESFNAG